jgi:hypothetical protein
VSEKTEPTLAEAAAGPAGEVATGRTIENPMMSWMRGGTLTSAYEAQLAQQKVNAEESRAVEDSKRIAAERNPLEAKQYKHVTGGNKKYPGIVLEVREPRDNKVLDYIECELHVLDDGSLMLQMACAWCAHRAGITENFNIRQTHRHFELDTRRQGELWVNPSNPRHIVTLAGTIQMTESFTCPNLGCGKRFVIDNSVVREK